VTRVRALLTWFILLCLCPAWAAPHRIELGPPGSEVEFRVYGMGLVPIDASFTRFGGWLSYDPEDKASCQVQLQVQVDSLVTGDSSIRDTIVGPDFLDAASFPTLEYTGTCDASGLGGVLAMHGVRRAFALALDWSQRGVVAQGRLVRADWGMVARPLLGGRTVRIKVSVPLQQTSHPAGKP
jgi:polyisoprenoid-binding protein YceI